MLSLFCSGNLKRGISFALVSICLYPILLFAEEITIAEPVSLQQVLKDITTTDPSILESLKQYESVVAERSIATSEYYPTIGAELSTGPERTDGVPTDFEEKNLIANTATIFARQNLYNGGKTSAFVDETDARIHAAAFEVLNVANNVYLGVAEAYINVIKARNILSIAEENALTQEKIMRQVREKTEAGFNRVSELYNSESRLVLSKGNYISRQQDLNHALVMFHRLFGRVLEPTQFVDPKPSYHIPSTLPETVAIAFDKHPALMVAKYNIEKTRYSYEKSTAAYYPTLDLELRGQYREDTGGEDGETNQSGAYLTLGYTFFDGGLRKGAKLRDQQAIRKEYQRSYIERRNVNETVRLAWNIMEAEQHKKEYLSEHVKLSAKTLGAFKEEYYVGRRTLLDLLNMENEYTDAEMSLAQSQYSYLTSLYQLMQATGVLLAEHDTGIRNILTLPEEPIGETEYEKDEYKDLDIDSNRDKDIAIDTVDQCDNTAEGSLAKQSGCEKENVNQTGYPHEEGWQISPYITAQDYSVPAGDANTLKDSSNGQLIDAVLILEVMADSRLLTRKSSAELADFAAKISGQSDVTVLIEGFTASDNNSAENIDLSERRANLVKDIMVKQGVDEAQITAVGRGIENPRAGNDTREGRTMNRRVEISVK
ncbi:MAG: adhesin transport system outer membrane protein [Desulforhopalus sp.]|jgi:adhesin transport system outer membrane protein